MIPTMWEGALCAETDPDAFFPEKGNSTSAAKRVCMGCENRPRCAQWALETNETHGVWGGLSEADRRRMRKRGLTIVDAEEAAA